MNLVNHVNPVILLKTIVSFRQDYKIYKTYKI